MKTSSFIGLIGVALQSSLLLLQPIQPAVAQDTTAPVADSMYKVASPLGETTAKMAAMAPRLDTLDGKTVCMVWNNAFKSDVTLAAIAEAMKKQYPSVNIVPYTAMPAAELPEAPGTPKKESAALQAAFKAKGADAVITGNGG